jgi:hypothetical protein
VRTGPRYPRRVEPEHPVPPVYDGPGLSSVVPALLGGRDVAWLPDPTRGARTVVVLVIDGLGWDAVTTRSEHLPEMNKLTGGPITTVAPSTTASALTSITTGRPPADHGVIGFRIVVDAIVLNVLSWQASNGRRPPEPFAVQRHPPFFGREVDVVTKAEFASTGFTEAHLRGARFHGWKAVSSLVEECRTLAAAGTPFVYAYYDGVDAVAHAHGLHDGFYDAELRAADRLVGDLLDALPEDAALVVISDHGQVHVGADGWRDLDGVADLVERCSGDGRFRYLHAKRGAAADLVTTATSLYRAEAWVLGRDELLERGWLGPVPSPATRRRVGDVVLAARGPVAYIDPALPREAGLISAHGSLTEAEMLVPLVAGRGRA